MKSISIILPNLIGGGAERLHVNLAKEWVSLGYSVEFVLMQAKGELIPLLPNDISIVALNVNRHHKAIIPLAGYFRRRKPDITIAAMWSLTSASVFSWWLGGRPGKLFLSDHTQLSVSCIKELQVSPNFLKFLLKLTYPLASGIIAVSKGVKDDLCKLGGFEENDVRVIYNPTAVGIVPLLDTKMTEYRIWGNDCEYRILAVGTLKVQKDHEMLIRAFALLKQKLNAKLIILGEGSLRQKLEGLIHELGLKSSVELPGFVLNPYPWYQTADLFVLSSGWEGFGNVLVEALESGLSIVSTDCPSGPAEILEYGKYGTLVPVGDVAALAEAMYKKLLEPTNPELLMERARDFLVGKIALEYLDFFRSKGALV